LLLCLWWRLWLPLLRLLSCAGCLFQVRKSKVEYVRNCSLAQRERERIVDLAIYYSGLYKSIVLERKSESKREVNSFGVVSKELCR
jgi:hypothetical protein